MHRCLNISEILQAIADRLGERNRAALLHLSLACRAFFDPAMNVLWSTLYDPENLVRILPEHTRSRETVDGMSQLKIVRSPSAADWQRLAEYACRVRVLECPHSLEVLLVFSDALSTPYWGTILQHLPAPQIFPNLHTLILKWARLFLHLELLILPPLRHLHIISLQEEAIVNLIDALPHCSTTLETISISTEFGSPHQHRFSDGFSHALMQLRSIVSLDSRIPFPHAIPHLSLLPTLRKLRLTHISVPGTMSLPFPALQSLSISIDDDTEHLLLPFLARLGVPALDELTIRYDIRLSVTVDRRLPATQIHDVLLNVSRSTRMRSFTLQGFELAAPPEDEHVLDLSILAPLLSLHDLETLEMRGVPVLLSSDDAATVARSWPKLRYLRICDKVRFEEPLRRRLLQADDLLPFARHCPKLETLGLPLEIVATSVPAGAPDLPPPSRIHKLCVAGVAERVSRDMLELFTRVFPWADVRAPSHSAGEAIWNLSVRGDLTDEDEDHEGEEEVEHERDEDESAEES